MAVRPIRKDVENRNTFRQWGLMTFTLGLRASWGATNLSYPLDAFARVQAGCTPDSSITDDTWGAWAR